MGLKCDCKAQSLTETILSLKKSLTVFMKAYILKLQQFGSFVSQRKQMISFAWLGYSHSTITVLVSYYHSEQSLKLFLFFIL